jgi:hypothetical protein
MLLRVDERLNAKMTGEIVVLADVVEVIAPYPPSL